MRIVGGLMIEMSSCWKSATAWIVIGIVPGQIKTLHTLPRARFQTAEAVKNPSANG